MKRLILLRHAKSSWKNPKLADHDRPLAGRGKRDAPRMGLHLLEAGYIPDVVYCSTALRARKTLKRVLKAMGVQPLIVEDPGIYEEDAQYMANLVAGTEQRHPCAMVVGHYPELQLLLEQLTRSAFPYPKFSTSGAAIVESLEENWRRAMSHNCALVHFMAPKLLPE